MLMEKLVNVHQKYLNASAVYQSPLLVDDKRVVDYDKEGNEVVSYVPDDVPSLVLANGSASNWQLNSLVSAGVNPDFGIRTGFNSRLDGYDQLNLASQTILDSIDSIDTVKSTE